MCHTFYGFAPGDFTEIENILDVGVHEYGSKVCQENIILPMLFKDMVAM